MSNLQRRGLLLIIMGNAILWGVASDSTVSGASHWVGLVVSLFGVLAFLPDEKTSADEDTK